mgnify:CR=1 FL=1
MKEKRGPAPTGSEAGKPSRVSGEQETAPGGYIDLDYIRADLTAPVPAMASFYAWNPAENGSRPTPPNDSGTAPSGEVTTVLAGIALACLTVGVVTILWHKRE